MAAGSDTLLRCIRRLAAHSAPDDATDAALLGRFVAARDERAFTSLVDRHGPMVFHVCRRVLGDADDAEDAFQATFLVLARKAARVWPREALPAWLHGVARRVALKARSARARRPRDARPADAPPADPRPDPLAQLSARELMLIVDEEMRRLPEAYRLPMILCCLEGRSLEEAARQLGWTAGSVKGRLERGRARLHGRLVRRGLTLSAALAAAEVSRAVAPAAALALLSARTIRGAIAFGARQPAAGAGISAGAAVLAGLTLRDMALAKLKLAAVLVLAIGLLAAASLVNRAAEAPNLAADSAAPAAPAAALPNPPAVPQDEASDRIAVSGRVFGPGGEPFAGARLYVGYSVRRPAADDPTGETAYPLRATSGADGRFHFTFARSELDARRLDDSRPAVIAVAGGFGPDWTELREADPDAELTLRLVEDLSVAGRILDRDRKPVAGASVVVREVIADSEQTVTGYLRGATDSWYPRRWRGPLPEQPAGATTDADGRFRLTGLGRDRLVSLALDGPAIRHTSLTAVARPFAASPGARQVHGAAFEYVAAPSQPIRGVVRDKATGRPVAGVKVSVPQNGRPAFTDESGRFEVLGCPKMAQGYVMLAQAQAGQPYFAARVSIPDRPGFDPLTVDLDLAGGIPLAGRVTDRATGKPPRAAVVEYHPLFPNGHGSRLALCPDLAASSALVRPDGSYSLVVLPGPGVVCVAASPRDSYTAAAVDEKELTAFFRDGINRGAGQYLRTALGDGKPAMLPVSKYSAFSPINPDERAESAALDFALQPARTLRGMVVGPDGRPLTGAEVAGLTARPDDERLGGASFTVTGLNPRGTRHLAFRQAATGLGKALTVRGDETGPLTVRLEPCGSVVGRLVDKDGRPVPGVTVCLGAGNGFGVTAETDRDGRFRAAVLPGQKCSLWLSNARRLLKAVGQVEAASGRSKDLGDLPLAE
jgi:RNA polymerase sigma factor (sigma-70 family)